METVLNSFFLDSRNKPGECVCVHTALFSLDGNTLIPTQER